jgi:hypothetical protein
MEEINEYEEDDVPYYEDDPIHCPSTQDHPQQYDVQFSAPRYSAPGQIVLLSPRLQALIFFYSSWSFLPRARAQGPSAEAACPISTAIRTAAAWKHLSSPCSSTSAQSGIGSAQLFRHSPPPRL